MIVIVYVFDANKNKLISFIDDDVSQVEFNSTYGTDAARLDIVTRTLEYHNMAHLVKLIDRIILKIESKDETYKKE